MVQHPAQRPFHRGAPHGRLVPDGLHGGRRSDQPQVAATQRLHDDHANPLARGVTQPIGARLIGLVQVVVLDLAELPGVSVDDALEVFRQTMERKPDVGDAPVVLGCFQKFQHAKPVHSVPQGTVQRVHQIVVDAIDAKAFKLRVQIAVHVGASLQQP